MIITKRNLRRIIREAIANEYSWNISTRENMMLDQDGREKSVKDRVEKFLKSMAMMS